MKQHKPQKVQVDWDKVKYFSFLTSTKKHKHRRVIPLSKLKQCITKEKPIDRAKKAISRLRSRT